MAFVYHTNVGTKLVFSLAPSFVSQSSMTTRGMSGSPCGPIPTYKREVIYCFSLSFVTTAGLNHLCIIASKTVKSDLGPLDFLKIEIIIKVAVGALMSTMTFLWLTLC